jgi:restriction system protein
MADITWKRTGALLRKLFHVLMQSPEGLPAGAALAKVADGETMSDYERGAYKSGNRRFEIIIRWATVDVVKAGWLLKHKGTWSVTEAGVEAYKKWPDPEAFYKEAVRLYREWKGSRDGTSTPPVSEEPSESEEAEKLTTITYEQADEQAWAEIESHVLKIDPYDFQDLVAELLKAMGYYPSWVSPRGKDGGIDIVAYPDPLGTRPPRVKVQVKRQQQRVTREGLSAFLAHVNEDDVGLFVCTAGFTKDADDFARNQERRKITLIDLERFVDLWIEFAPKLSEKTRDQLRLTPIYFLTPRS